jgi:ferredoxin--NADP+ reductase
VNFVANTEIGKNISLEDLRAEFQVVVLATGLSADRELGIAGDNLPGVYGSGRLTRLINGHPEETHEGIELGDSIVIVGQGNVAIDLIRLSLTSADELVALGVKKPVAEVISSGRPKNIYAVGRSTIESAKFDVAMVKELAKLKGVKFTSDSEIIESANEEAQRRIDAINSLVENSPTHASQQVNFRFGWHPRQISGDSKVSQITFSASTREDELTIEADAVVTAIGFTESGHSAIKLESLVNQNSDLQRGFLDDGLYCVGWLRRGPQGTIPANRADAKLVSESIIKDFEITQT